MRSPYCFIVEPLGGARYDSVKNGITLSASKEDARYSNRHALVIETPLDYTGEITPGDTLLVHHNVFKYYNDIQGREKSGRSFLKEGQYIVDPDQWFMYKKDGQWKTFDRYCFVEPVSVKKHWINSPGLSSSLTGRITYSNDQLESLGITVGDLIGFTPESEYEFDIDGKVMYRMFTNNICLKYEE
jgi:hypothetical protein